MIYLYHQVKENTTNQKGELTMGKSAMALGNELREVFAQVIEQALANDYDVLRVPLSADSTSDGFQLAIPTTDSEQNEKTVLIHISVPKGNRDGVPYDPYEENERYKENVAAKKSKESARAEKKAREEAERQRKKEAKKTIKTMKKDMEEIFGDEKPTEEA
jgi:hypothetical protein